MRVADFFRESFYYPVIIIFPLSRIAQGPVSSQPSYMTSLIKDKFIMQGENDTERKSNIFFWSTFGFWCLLCCTSNRNLFSFVIFFLSVCFLLIITLVFTPVFYRQT